MTGTDIGRLRDILVRDMVYKPGKDKLVVISGGEGTEMQAVEGRGYELTVRGKEGSELNVMFVKEQN